MFPGDKHRVRKFMLELQQRICAMIEAEEPDAKFREDHWTYGEGGGGQSNVLTSQVIIEKAGVNFSHVQGKSLPPAALVRHPELINKPFEAMGVSVVIHPVNPYAPTTHANVRFFMAESTHWWFGGGFDLTPYYGFIEDCEHWHQRAKAICDPFGLDMYPSFKKACDDYFYLKHREEPRGIGGIFFDDLQLDGFEKSFEFIQKVGEGFIQAYQPILNKRKSLPFGNQEKEFQRLRRGRYVEFNLLYDRGTLFGLQSGGRTESILMSLPPEVCWKYNWHPEKGSPEAALYEQFLIKREWI